MNRLLTKKKNRDVGLNDKTSPPETSYSASNSGPSKKKGWRMKKAKPEPEPPVDIKTVLPPAENFRTSLILPNLSTRFSMLKEQDDPRSLLGKASDDSVLAPKRRSRLGEFGYSNAGLSDIAEVASLTSSVHTRPPTLAQRNGSYTYGEGYGTDDDSSYNGSIMGRSRPGEGNMLFGGRQKIYRIPIGDAGAVSNLGNSESRGMRGRALYEDDVSMSAFQKLREEEKELARLEREMELEAMNRDGLDSPALSYNERRETVSSTNSGPSMMGSSTAPTSVAASSPGLPSTNPQQFQTAAMERSRSRKLYEQGLDQHIQEQHSAALGRLTSLKRNGSGNGPSAAPYRSRSASNMHDRFETSMAPAARTASPLPIPEVPTPSARSPLRPSLDQPSVQPQAPSQDDNDAEKRNALWEAMNPSDRGMATAMGTFNRPQKYDEQQFLERQMSLLKQQPRRPQDMESNKSGSPTSAHGNQPFSAGYRSRADTTRTDRSWSSSSVRDEGAFSRSNPPTFSNGNHMKGAPSRPSQERSTSDGTFFTQDEANDDSDYGESTASRAPQYSNRFAGRNGPAARPPPPQNVPPPILTHPAMRSEPGKSSSPQKNKEKRRAWSPDELQSGLAAAGGPHKEYLEMRSMPEKENPPEVIEPPAEDKTNIRGLIHEHLRNHSGSSSIYPALTPGPESTEFNIRPSHGYDTASPWDVAELDRDDTDLPEPPLVLGSNATPEPTPPMSTVDRRPNAEPDWQRELNKQHARGGSTETAHERQAFASELAQRQKTIQENLKAKTEYTPSPPSTSSKNVFESSLKQFGMLRPKPSGDSLQNDREGANSPAPPHERNFQKPRVNREGAMSPIIGRTLHSRLPREYDDAPRELPREYSRAPRPSLENPPRPSQDSEQVPAGSTSTAPSRAPPSRTSPPESSRTSVSKQRSSSEASAHQSPPQSVQNADDSKTRPSVDTSYLRRDSGNGRSPVASPSPDKRNLQREQSTKNILTKESGGSPALSPAEPAAPNEQSTSVPPPSSTTTSDMTAATGAHTSTSQHEEEVPQGFFFPVPAAPQGPEMNRKMSSKTGSQSRPRRPTISKNDISEPKLINSTSSVPTVQLPPGASLQNGLRDDFDVVLMGTNSSAPAPSPNVPTGDKPRKGGFLAHFGRKDSTAERERQAQLQDDEPEPAKFRIRRLEAEERNDGLLKPMHRAYRASATESIHDLSRGIL